MKTGQTFADLPELAAHLRQELQDKRYVLLYAYNGTGKTRLSMAFKDLGKQGDTRDTLYFNAFTEDLFTWDNDLDGDTARKLEINEKSHFFDGLKELEMDNRIRPLLQRYADFDFRIDTEEWAVHFSPKDKPDEFIKVSRGEQNTFIWCFFLAIFELVLDGAEAYKGIRYVYIDDPISSLDEQNAVMVANHLANLLKRSDHAVKAVVSTHHTLFFNVLSNELRDRKKFSPYLLSRNKKTDVFSLHGTGDTPFFQHLFLLQELHRAHTSGEVYTYHFNALRSLLEKASIFHGYEKFSACIKKDEDDPGETFYGRLVNVLSHGNYSFHDPLQMLPDTREQFDKVLTDFLEFYPFNPQLFPQDPEQDPAK